MNSSGDLLPLEEVKKLSKKEQADFREIQQEELPEVQGMNRHERRKWWALNKNNRKKV